MAAMALPVLLFVMAAVILQVLPHGPQPPAPPQMASAEVVLDAGASGIGIEAQGRGFRLLTPRENVSYTVRSQGAVRARYLDSETGQVMISHVYAQ
jgi:hypothetical protein